MMGLIDPPLILPADATAEMHRGARIPGLPGYPHLVVITPSAAPTSAGATTQHTILTHDAGTEWPDPWCAGQAATMLGLRGGVLLAFADLTDARACMARLVLERHQ